MQESLPIVKVSEYIARFIESKRVGQVYELVGGMITHLIDSIHRCTRIKIVSMHHEQAAAFAAEGSARMTGVPGVAFATSGPGAVNLLTGVGSCFFDSVPVVFITGQVNRNEMRGNIDVRQLGFQETDIVAMAKPITKGSWVAMDPVEVPALIERAFALAISGRPGPVLIDIPMDVQKSELSKFQEPQWVRSSAGSLGLKNNSNEMITQLSASQRPLVVAGGGIRAAQAGDLFLDFVSQFQIPVVHSLMGVDLLPYGHEMRVGMIGTYGNRWANHALSSSDFLLVLGSRLDVRQTGADTELFRKNKIIWHVDVDPHEINNRVKDCHGIVSDLKDFFRDMTAIKTRNTNSGSVNWPAEIAKLRNRWPDTKEQTALDGINPNEFIHLLSQCFSDAAAYVSDVGQHQMWAAQSIELTAQQRFLTSGGMGSMGFALPAGIGAATVCPNDTIVVIAGDGGLQSNIQELQTVVRNNLKVKIIVMNNKSLGMVRQFQEAYFGKRFQSTVWGYSAPDFPAIALAYGIPARRVADNKELYDAIKWLHGVSEGSALLDVDILQQKNAYPKTMFGNLISEMEPQKG